jgi:hypothetical protein
MSGEIDTIMLLNSRHYWRMLEKRKERGLIWQKALYNASRCDITLLLVRPIRLHDSSKVMIVLAILWEFIPQEQHKSDTWFQAKSAIEI